jgi:hypothetical protein
LYLSSQDRMKLLWVSLLSLLLQVLRLQRWITSHHDSVACSCWWWITILLTLACCIHCSLV